MPCPKPEPWNMNAAGTGELLTLGLGLGEPVGAMRILLETPCAEADKPKFAHNEHSAIPSAISRRGLDIIPLPAVAGEELLALESNTFLPELLVT